MAQEYTLKLAIQFSKRQVEKYGFGNFPTIEDIWGVAKDMYYLREDEKASYFKSMRETFNNDEERCMTNEERQAKYEECKRMLGL